MQWMISDRFVPTAHMRSDRLKGCTVHLDEHFDIPNVGDLWAELPSAQHLLNESLEA